MNQIDPKILDKIKKCLALGSSPNPNEAAAAMRQAHALMRKHGVDASHVAMAEIGESEVKSRTMARDKPAKWEAALVATVGKAFGCKMLISRMVRDDKRVVNEGTYIFIGLKAQAEIAAYTASVLVRKCKGARQDFIREKLAGLRAVGAKKKVTAMADAFAEGWVWSIQKLVTDFANPPEIDEAVERHIASQKTGPGDAPVRSTKDVGGAEIAAAKLGMEAAKGESLYRPMNTGPAPLAIGVVA